MPLRKARPVNDDGGGGDDSGGKHLKAFCRRQTKSPHATQPFYIIEFLISWPPVQFVCCVLYWDLYYRTAEWLGALVLSISALSVHSCVRQWTTTSGNGGTRQKGKKKKKNIASDNSAMSKRSAVGGGKTKMTSDCGVVVAAMEEGGGKKTNRPNAKVTGAEMKSSGCRWETACLYRLLHIAGWR